MRTGRGAFAFSVRAGDIQQAEKEADGAENSGRHIRWRRWWLHDSAGIDHKGPDMKRLAVHEVLERLNSMVILGVVR